MTTLGLQRSTARFIVDHAAAFSEQVTARQFATNPMLDERYGEAGRAACTRDAVRHLEYLAQAIEVDSPRLFIDYVGWVKVLLERLAMPGLDLGDHLHAIDAVLTAEMPPEMTPLVRRHLDAGRAQLQILPTEVDTFLEPREGSSGLARDYLDALLAGDRRRASRLILDAVDRGVQLRSIYLDVFQRCQYEIGRLWQLNRITVAQEHFCTAATQLVMSQLYDRIFTTEKRGRTLVATCATNDLHELGVRMVSDFFEIDGWDTFYLGANTPISATVSEVVEREADVLALSVTISTHLGFVRDTITAVRAEPRCASTRILVGGYPFSLDADLWRKIGADATAADATTAVAVANEWLDRHAP